MTSTVKRRFTRLVAVLLIVGLSAAVYDRCAKQGVRDDIETAAIRTCRAIITCGSRRHVPDVPRAIETCSDQLITALEPPLDKLSRRQLERIRDELVNVNADCGGTCSRDCYGPGLHGIGGGFEN